MTELPVGGGAFHDALSSSANRFCRLDRHRRSRSTHVITTSRPRAMMTLHCNTLRYIRTICSGLKIKLHGTYTDTDTDTDFLADLSADFRPTRALVLGVLARMSVGKRACTRVRVLYMINYRVHVYKITRWRNPNVGVRVRVGPVGFQLYATSVTTTGTHLPYDRTGCYLPPSRGDNPAFIPAN